MLMCISASKSLLSRKTQEVDPKYRVLYCGDIKHPMKNAPNAKVERS